ncbi:MAG: hypothetical protein ABI406_19480 [Ktedonobacteraceae bacterium]
MPGNDGTDGIRQFIGQRGYRYILSCCSICTSVVWFHHIALKEPVGAPEPRHEWILCKPCHEALLVEMRRSSLRSPVRLRIAIGLVAAERSPIPYDRIPHIHEQQTFQREFVWGVRFMIFFALLHLVIFAILLSVPR